FQCTSVTTTITVGCIAVVAGFRCNDDAVAALFAELTCNGAGIAGLLNLAIGATTIAALTISIVTDLGPADARSLDDTVATGKTGLTRVHTGEARFLIATVVAATVTARRIPVITDFGRHDRP